MEQQTNQTQVFNKTKYYSDAHKTLWRKSLKFSFIYYAIATTYVLMLLFLPFISSTTAELQSAKFNFFPSLSKIQSSHAIFTLAFKHLQGPDLVYSIAILLILFIPIIVQFAKDFKLFKKFDYYYSLLIDTYYAGNYVPNVAKNVLVYTWNLWVGTVAAIGLTVGVAMQHYGLQINAINPLIIFPLSALIAAIVIRTYELKFNGQMIDNINQEKIDISKKSAEQLSQADSEQK